MLQSRPECGGELHPGDLYLCFNGGKHRVSQEICNTFANDEAGRGLKTEKRAVFLRYEEESIVARSKKDTASEVRHDALLQITKDPMIFTGRKRLHFDGTNCGSILAPMALLLMAARKVVASLVASAFFK